MDTFVISAALAVCAPALGVAAVLTDGSVAAVLLACALFCCAAAAGLSVMPLLCAAFAFAALALLFAALKFPPAKQPRPAVLKIILYAVLCAAVAGILGVAVINAAPVKLHYAGKLPAGRVAAAVSLLAALCLAVKKREDK